MYIALRRLQTSARKKKKPVILIYIDVERIRILWQCERQKKKLAIIYIDVIYKERKNNGDLIMFKSHGVKMENS